MSKRPTITLRIVLASDTPNALYVDGDGCQLLVWHGKIKVEIQNGSAPEIHVDDLVAHLQAEL